MKLSQVLKDWPEKKINHNGKDCICHAYYDGECGCGADWTDHDGYNTALTSCDREIDREALEKYLENYFDNHEFADMTFCSGGLADDLIKSMPTWLKRIEDK